MPAALLCCLLFSTTMVWAEEYPTIVYRADLRQPWDVFTHGFLPLNNDDDIHKHVSGASCQTRILQGTTAFVDTTADYGMAKVWGEQLLDKQDVLVRSLTRTFYIYHIFATSNFFNCTLSLLKAERDANQRGNKELARLIRDDLNTAVGVKERWLAYYGIPSELISLAEERIELAVQHSHEYWNTKYNPNAFWVWNQGVSTIPYNPGSWARPFIQIATPDRFTACFIGIIDTRSDHAVLPTAVTSEANDQTDSVEVVTSTSDAPTSV